jgi:transposase
MPKIPRPPAEPTDDWDQLRLRLKWPEQQIYELIRPVVVWGRSATDGAAETKTPRRTLAHKAARFDQQGMLSLFATPPAAKDPNWRELPRPMQQVIVDLQAQYAGFRPHEIATICYVQFGRRPSPHTVQRVLAEGPPPSRTNRRIPRYHEISDPAARRFAVLRLHAEGWNIKTIAAYMEINRSTVYDILRRWAEEKVLDDKSRANHNKVRKVDLATMNAVRKLQENPELGEFRIHAALKQMGIHISARTCGRILAVNRKIYGLGKTEPEPHEPKPHPYKATRRHQYWTVDIRYIDAPLVSSKPVYVISLLENFSRAILASKISPTQDLWAYLEVLHSAIRDYGIPEVLVSDSGAVFRAKQAQLIYRLLGITKEEIAKRQPWQSLIETQFNIQRRMTDFYFEKAANWAELDAAHRQWLYNFNTQVHWAHRKRQDGRHTPGEVLGWVRVPQREQSYVDRLFYTWRARRRVDRGGYIRFRQWRIYAEFGLAGVAAVVWRYSANLTIEFHQQPLAQYEVQFQPDKRHLQAVTERQLFNTPFRSPQLMLWTREEVEWHLVQRLPVYPVRKRVPITARQLPLFAVEQFAS